MNGRFRFLLLAVVIALLLTWLVLELLPQPVLAAPSWRHNVIREYER